MRYIDLIAIILGILGGFAFAQQDIVCIPLLFFSFFIYNLDTKNK